MRVLILSWEYPPLIEGGLARHVRKLSENLVRQDVEVHVLTRGQEESPAEEEMEGVLVHRVREPRRPRELGEFVTWIEHMNADMLAAGVELGDRFEFDLVHGHDWLVAAAGDHLARHVRKLSENLVAQGVDVHVLTRGMEESPAEQEIRGVTVHRVREPKRPRELAEFVAWVEHMNSDMLAAGVELAALFAT